MCLFLEREVWASNLRPVKLDSSPPLHISTKAAVLPAGAKVGTSNFGVIHHYNKDLIQICNQYTVQCSIDEKLEGLLGVLSKSGT